MSRVRVRCTVCDRPLKGGRGRACVRDCGARLCRAARAPQCSDVHAGQCPHLEPSEGETR